MLLAKLPRLALTECNIKARGCFGRWSGSVSSQRRTYGDENSSGIKVPPSARVVVCGGGVIGTSVAYHIAEKGWKDVVLIEQGR